MQVLVNALNKDGDCFKYICKTLANLSDEKLKVGIFDGPQVRNSIKDPKSIAFRCPTNPMHDRHFCFWLKTSLKNLKSSKITKNWSKT